MDAVRPWIGTGLLVGAVLAAIALFPFERPITAGLALVAVGALATRAALSLPGVGRALGPFGPPLDLVLELALALTAARLTGGPRSPLLLLAAANLVLARRFHGPSAARFLALATTVGLVVLSAASPALAAERPLLAAAAVLWPLAVLAAMEVAEPRPPGRGVTRIPPAAAAPTVGEVAPVATAPVPPAAVPAQPPAGPAVPDARSPSPARPLPEPARAGDSRNGILHDLRSPLSVIKVYADLIAERARRGEPPVDEHLRNLASEIELMTLIVEGPAATGGRRAAPAHDAVDLVRLLDELCGRYRETHGDRVRIELSAERPRVVVSADPVSLQRVFRNVLDNALQYTPRGGLVRVRVWSDATYAHVVVSDTGVGMTPEERERAFETAYRGRGAQALRAGGRGLGLTLSRELVEAMGGGISLWSEEDRGSEVRVLLPVAAEAGP